MLCLKILRLFNDVSFKIFEKKKKKNSNCKVLLLYTDNIISAVWKRKKKISYHMKHFLKIYFWAFFAFIDRAAERRQEVSGRERWGGIGK